MNMMKSSNPALSNAFGRHAYAGTQSAVMTMNGTINKTIISLLLVMVGAGYTWKMTLAGGGNAMIWTMGGAIVGLVLALVTAFKKEWAPYTVPAYALVQGLFLGGISAMIAGSMSQDPGASVNNQLVVQAVALTIGVFFVMLLLYRSKVIQPTRKFALGLAAATGGIFFFYLISWIVGMFGVNMSAIHGNGTLAIGINLVIVVVAALNLIMDFHFIEEGVAARAPKYMEWYGAFGLMVTLIWLYIELLKLLSRLGSRD
jgi:uncharacterized YccA/Bax inhibitor family protein